LQTERHKLRPALVYVSKNDNESVFYFQLWYGGFNLLLKGCLLDCFDWESNYCAIHWCSLIGRIDT